MNGQRRSASPLVLAAAATVSAVSAVAAVAQWRHLRGIASDPQRALLATAPSGRSESVRSADGTVLHAMAFGDEQAPAIVLAPGWTEAIGYWAYQIRDLASDYHVVAFDLRGHGGSGRAPGGDYRLARFGEDVEAVLAHFVADDRRAIVVGHSLGAMSIAAWAQRHDVRRRAAAVALVNTGVADLIAEAALLPVPAFARALADPVGRRAFLGRGGPLPSSTSPLQHALLRYIAFGPAATPAQVAHYEQMLVRCPADVRAAVGLAMADMDLMDAVANLAVPTLVVAGDRDRLTPAAHATRIAAALPNLTRLLVLADTGHMGPLERAGEVNAALRELAGTVGH